MSIKIQPRQYAQLLFDITNDKTDKEINEALSEFVSILRKKHHTKYFNHIVRLFEDIYNKEHNILSVSVESIESLDLESEKEIERYIKANYPNKKVLVNKKINPRLKGGVVVRAGDKLIDGSVTRNMTKLRQVLRLA